MSKWSELKAKYGVMWELQDPILALVWIEGDNLHEKAKKMDELIEILKRGRDNADEVDQCIHEIREQFEWKVLDK